ncbi:MAG: hypothetical protein F4155_01215 [Acidimicrobiales bacterium]|nr:hypothetical protein [Acidimicrobiales bacterium]
MCLLWPLGGAAEAHMGSAPKAIVGDKARRLGLVQPAPADRPAAPSGCEHRPAAPPLEVVVFAEGSALRVAAVAEETAERQLCGPDAALFEIDGGALRFGLRDGRRFVPDFEQPDDADGDNRYEVTLSGAAGVRRLQVRVGDRDESGTVRLSQPRPSVGIPLEAHLSDPDDEVGAVSWRWERSVGPGSFAPIDGAAGALYVPQAADSGRRLRAVAAYADRHGTAEATAAASGTVLGPLLASLSARADSGGQTLAPAFSPDVLHYKIACDASDVVTVAATLPAGARLDVNGIGPRIGPGGDARAAVTVTDTSDIVLSVADADGAVSRYVVHCVPEVLAGLTAQASAEAPPVPLLSFIVQGWLAVVDQHGVPRFHREPAAVGSGIRPGFYLRPFGEGAARRWAHAGGSGTTGPDGRAWTILDAAFAPVAQVSTAPPLATMGLHDFRLLADGSMLAMTYEPAVRDFSWLSQRSGAGSTAPAVRFDDPDGRRWGRAVETSDSAVQLLDADGSALWTWNSWGRVPLEDCAAHRFPDDYAHLNSIQMTPGGVLASLRGCSTVMLIDHRAPDGDEIAWRIGQTNLEPEHWAARGLGPAPLRLVGDPLGAFCGQHAASLIGPSSSGAPEQRLLLFDNGVACVIDPATGLALSRPGGEYSRAVEYAIDPANGEAVFVRDHSQGGLRTVLGAVGGHVELLDGGTWLISWGQGGGGEEAAVSVADPRTGGEMFTVPRSSIVGGHARALPVDADALDSTVGPLTAAFTDIEPVEPGPISGDAVRDVPGGGDSPPDGRVIGVAVAFSRPVVDFSADSPSVEVSGGTLVAAVPRVEFGKPANSYLLAVVPDGSEPVSVRLAERRPCADGGICTADGTSLSAAPPPWTCRSAACAVARP